MNTLRKALTQPNPQVAGVCAYPSNSIRQQPASPSPELTQLVPTARCWQPVEIEEVVTDEDMEGIAEIHQKEKFQISALIEEISHFPVNADGDADGDTYIQGGNNADLDIVGVESANEALDGDDEEVGDNTDAESSDSNEDEVLKNHNTGRNSYHRTGVHREQWLPPTITDAQSALADLCCLLKPK